MKKVYEALNKLYFALGEEKGLNGKDAASLASMSDWYSFCALRDYDRDRCSDRSRYFLMGVAAAHRKAAKPPKGKKQLHPDSGKGLPPGGRKPEKSGKTVKFSKPLSKATKRILAGEDFDNDFEAGLMEGDEWDG